MRPETWNLEKDSSEIKRRHKILSFVILSSIIIIGYLHYTVIRDSFLDGVLYTGISSALSGSVLGLIFFILALQKRGYLKTSSYLIISIYLSSAIGCSIYWGVSLPTCLLIYAFVIVVSGLLLDTRATITTTIIISLLLIILGTNEIDLQKIAEWKTQQIRIEDIFEYIAILLLILVVSIISNNEIRRSLYRAKLSEHLLKQEKDLLEVKIFERTQELRNQHTEHIQTLQNYAEIGKVAREVFHDIIGPLSTINLYVKKIDPSESHVDRLLTMTNRMKDFLASIERNVRNIPENESFHPSKEIRYAIDVLEFRARNQNVKIKQNTHLESQIIGPSVRFYQLILNLISNSLNAFTKIDNNSITITASENNGYYILDFEDNGPGILPSIFHGDNNNLSKEISKNSLGLIIIKKIIIDDFKGSIELIKKENGTHFKITIPVKTAQSVYPPEKPRAK